MQLKIFSYKIVSAWFCAEQLNSLLSFIRISSEHAATSYVHVHDIVYVVSIMYMCMSVYRYIKLVLSPLTFIAVGLCSVLHEQCVSDVRCKTGEILPR